uniref:Candidate secreted effector n=1 Tax=Meloidogyne incognita TaxID=6306 RepID=A0A914KPY8_MELIC
MEDVVVEQPQQSNDDKNEEDETVVNEPYGGYRIELPDDNIQQQQQIPSTSPQNWNQPESENIKRNTNLSKSSSSGSSDSGRKAFPVIQIDMKGYGY